MQLVIINVVVFPERFPVHFMCIERNHDMTVGSLTEHGIPVEQVRELDVSSGRSHCCPGVLYDQVNVTIHGLQGEVVVICHRDVFWKRT